MKSQLQEGDYYLSEEGYRVFTEQYHLRRGYCCKNGCRHCPYGYDAKTDRVAKTSPSNSSHKGGQKPQK